VWTDLTDWGDGLKTSFILFKLFNKSKDWEFILEILLSLAVYRLSNPLEDRYGRWEGDLMLLRGEKSDNAGDCGEDTNVFGGDDTGKG